MVGEIGSLALLAAVACHLAGRARAELGRCAVIWRKHQAALVAALEHAVAAVHFPRFFGGKLLRTRVDVRLKRLQRSELLMARKLRVYVSKCVEMAEAAPK